MDLSPQALLFLIKHKNDYFANPYDISLKDSFSIKEALQKAERELCPEDCLYFKLIILSNGLLRSKTSQYLKSLDIPLIPKADLLTKLNWIGVPVIVVSGLGRPRVIWFMLGKGEAIKSIVDISKTTEEVFELFSLFKPHILPDALKAIKRAFEAANKLNKMQARFFVYPLFNPKLELAIFQTSLCLPLAIGATCLLRGERPFRPFLATGDLDEGLRVRQVGAIEKKLDYAKDNKYRLFIYPSENGQYRCEGIEAVPVEDLLEAYLWAVKFQNNPEEIRHLSLLFHSSPDFVNNCDMVSGEALKWAFNFGLKEQFEGIFKQRDTALSFVKTFGNWCRYQRPQARVCYRHISPRLIEGLKSISYRAAFCLCSYLFKLSTHYGWLQEAEEWKEMGERLVNSVLMDAEDKVFSFLNSVFIHERHNRYVFLPELPSVFKEIVKRLERRYKGTFNKILGKFYGTIAQNYGFCGLQYLSETIRYAKLAQMHFGSGQNPDLKEDYERQFAYIFFAYLDAGRPKEATKALENYLKGRLELCETTLKDKFRLFAWLRWKNEMGASLRPQELSLVKERLKTRDIMCHPFQLIFYNLGMCLLKNGQREPARQAFYQAIGICDGIRGEAVKVMKLLPLCGLYQMDIFEKEAWQDGLKVAECLNKEHFKGLLLEDCEEACKRLMGTPQKWFPFSYR